MNIYTRNILGLVLSGVLSLNLSINAQNGLIIQENTLGVCTMDGDIDSAAAGYTGVGYANITDGMEIGMSWSFTVPAAGTYSFYCRYALGGADMTSRDAQIIINNQLPEDTIKFPHISSLWSDWESSDTVEVLLEEGINTIRLSSITHKGLPNIDYFHVFGTAIDPAQCVPAYTFNISSNNMEAGSVGYDPEQFLYESGTVITVEADANPGYFFHSWSGEESSTDNPFIFELKENTNLEALFYPEGTEMEGDAIGYATVQHDNGTPYLLIGGALGDTVQATTTEELKSYLEDDLPRVVILASQLSGTASTEIKIGSNKTLLGRTNAHIQGMRVTMENARNVVIKDVRFSEVIRFDEIEINSNTRNVWIDHCEFYTDLDHDIDYYDGLLDIKNQARFLTFSWSKFHDHQKCILISSGDTQLGDSVIRATFHHNHFYDANSRLPSIRFGKAHIFNNYYKNISTGVNTRMNACVKVENNYFEDAGTGVGMLYSPAPGAVELINNTFINTSYSEEPACFLDVPYEYTAFLDDTEDVPQLVSDSAGPRYPVIDAIPSVKSDISSLSLYPNPANDILIMQFMNSESQQVSISIINMLGKETVIEKSRTIYPGWNKMDINTNNLPKGIYLVKMETGNKVLSQKIIIL